MQLSQQALQEFQAIYHEEYGVELSDNEAQEMARCLLQLFAVIYRPLPVIDVDNVPSDGMVEARGHEPAEDDAHLT